MKRAFISSFVKIKGDQFFYHLNKTPRVVFWHGVDIVKNARIEAEQIDVDMFKRQLAYLMSKFEIISIAEFENRFNNGNFSGRELVLTFDDGYKNNLFILAPLLRAYSIPFAVFISTNKITTGDIFPTSLLRLIIYGSSVKRIESKFLGLDLNLVAKNSSKKSVYNYLSQKLKTLPLKEVDYLCEDIKNSISLSEFDELKNTYTSNLPMNWEDVKKILSYGCTIGSHCKDHICCHENQNPLVVQQQIFESKIEIEKMLGISCDYFAYPNGNFTNLSNNFVVSAGYKMGFSTKPDKITPKCNIASIPRICLPKDFDLMKMKINYYPR